jgi:hypothetical protein
MVARPNLIRKNKKTKRKRKRAETRTLHACHFSVIILSIYPLVKKDWNGLNMPVTGPKQKMKTESKAYRKIKLKTQN